MLTDSRGRRFTTKGHQKNKPPQTTQRSLSQAVLRAPLLRLAFPRLAGLLLVLRGNGRFTFHYFRLHSIPLRIIESVNERDRSIANESDKNLGFASSRVTVAGLADMELHLRVNMNTRAAFLPFIERLAGANSPMPRSATVEAQKRVEVAIEPWVQNNGFRHRGNFILV